MIDDAKLDELLALAEKATPGPWVAHESLEFVTGEVDSIDSSSVRWKENARVMYVAIEADRYGGEEDEEAEEWARSDRAFIAATNPETIRALVNEIKSRRAKENEIRALTRYDLATGGEDAWMTSHGCETTGDYLDADAVFAILNRKDLA